MWQRVSRLAVRFQASAVSTDAWIRSSNPDSSRRKRISGAESLVRAMPGLARAAPSLDGSGRARSLSRRAWKRRLKLGWAGSALHPGFRRRISWCMPPLNYFALSPIHGILPDW